MRLVRSCITYQAFSFNRKHSRAKVEAEHHEMVMWLHVYTLSQVLLK